MAMEVIPKQLHQHARLVALTVVSFTFLISLAASGTAVGQCLVTRPVSIQPTRNGLAKLIQSSTNDNNLDTAGQAANFALALH